MPPGHCTSDVVVPRRHAARFPRLRAGTGWTRDPQIQGILVHAGSHGQGSWRQVSRWRGGPRRGRRLPYVDGEWNEGSTWETLIFAAHQRLTNLTFITDLNGLQGFGATREVANLDPLVDRLRAFGVETVEIDGHDPAAIATTLARADAGPLSIVAKTVKGCGVSFMENRMEWHYLPLTAATYKQAVDEVRGCATHSAVA